MELSVKVTFLLGLVSVSVSVNGLELTDWKPIIGTSPGIKTLHQPILVDGSALVGGSSSSSKSSITFNGQTITTSIQGDPSANDAIGTVLTSKLPDELDGHGRYLDYPGKILSGFFTGSAAPPSDQCPLEKYAFEHEGTIQYDVSVPKLDQFTLCAWMRFTTHKGDHSIFTYSVDGEPREIQFWIANTQEASYVSLAVHGQSLFRLNYPLKLRKWHHACASWNGKTGEWQLWVKAERVGRGFHNRLVGHSIKGNGVSYSGGPSITGSIAPGHHMEVTVLQLYKVALSAGKAHRDHKHHHVHHFNHDGQLMTTQAPTPPPTQPTPNPLLANGPVLNRMNFNFLDPQQAANILPTLQTQLFPGQSQLFPQAQAFTGQLAAQPQLQPQPFPGQTQFANGQFSTAQRYIQEQFSPPPVATTAPPTAPIQFPPEPQQDAQQVSASPSPSPSLPTSLASSFFNLNPANVQFIDAPNAIQSFGSNHALFKRNNEDNNDKVKRVKIKRTIKRSSNISPKIMADAKVDGNNGDAKPNGEKVNKKRALVALSDGSFVDDKNIADGQEYTYDGLSQFGASDFQDGLTRQTSIEDEIKEHDREAAEDEVKAVLTVCSSCEIEPFIGAVVIAWKDAKVQPEHAIKGFSVGGCGEF